MNNARKWQLEQPYQVQQPKKKVIVRVKRRAWVTKGEKIIYTFLAAVFVVACLYMVHFASKTDLLNREMLALEAEVHQQKLENKALYFEVSELSSPERIIKIAREHGLEIQEAKVMQATAQSN